MQRFAGRFAKGAKSFRNICTFYKSSTPGKYVAQHIKTCCTTYKYSCKLRKKAVPLHIEK